jgi:hypothetical protein
MRRLRSVLLILIALAYLASIPWYRQPESEPRIWLGLPDWVLVALACYVLAALLNAAAWLVTEVRDAPPNGDES